jgi:hypothetical protein
MAKSLLDQLREHLEDVENTWLYIFTVMTVLSVVAGITLLGVFLYTRR